MTATTAAVIAAERDRAGLASPWEMALREFRHWLTNYRRTWRGSAYSSFLNPLLYLGSIGLGLGTLVNKHGTAPLGGISYLAFLAPGLLAATGMQTAIGEATYPVLGSVKWRRTYQAAVASPLRPDDLFYGHLLFTVLRLAMNCVAFMVVMAAFGAVESPWAVLALPASILTGLAFAVPIEAWAISLQKDAPFAYLFRFGLIPLFLFSGTFFPVGNLPAWAQPVAYATPLWHGVALCRSLSLGRIPVLESLGHIAYLAVLILAGLYAGRLTYRRRLYV